MIFSDELYSNILPVTCVGKTYKWEMVSWEGGVRRRRHCLLKQSRDCKIIRFGNPKVGGSNKVGQKQKCNILLCSWGSHHPRQSLMCQMGCWLQGCRGRHSCGCSASRCQKRRGAVWSPQCRSDPACALWSRWVCGSGLWHFPRRLSHGQGTGTAPAGNRVWTENHLIKTQYWSTRFSCLIECSKK